MIDACDGCLRRAFLVAHLAPRIAGLLDSPRRRPRGLLALSDERLIASVCGTRDGEPREWLDNFDADRTRDSLATSEAWAVCLHAAAFPAMLGELADPPAVLFGCGDPERLEDVRARPAVALVGARRASPYGLEMARHLGRGLAAAGVPVVSGLALGIDAAAHLGSLDGRGPSIAVLAGGPEIAYPRRNRRLHRRLCEEGAVVSELPPGRPALRWSFPARNRIMAGLSAMTVVVEGAEGSGSLISADFARDLGRTVGAVPGRANSRLAAGSNRLLQDGAALVTSPQDVLDELYGVGAHAGRHEAPSAPEPDVPELREVLAAVEAGEDPAGIARAAGLPAAQARAALGRLEAEGYVARDALGGYRRRMA